ncbi:MAG: 6,7-dimethyl-8-ribityllumazine synthase [Gammaproteobacteria bacterium]|nr:6,7-dimethyl-8-ribityllumazine synthase [Gammaproteobacteria bacterium]
MDGVRIIEGELQAGGLRFALVAARFNEFIVERLIDGALRALAGHGAAPAAITLVRVPGAFDLPPVAQQMARSGQWDAIVALGAVIRGETAHFDFVAGECAAGLARVALDTGVPVVFGVLTTATVTQAADRAGGKDGNRGADAATAAVRLANLHRRLGAG